MSRYSIDEMMALKDNASIDIGRFTISALENNLLRRHKTNSAPDKELGSKSSSESRRGDRSTTTSDDSYHKLNSQISSETDDAKESKSSSGFVNFLKRHASPKHQRVTPGGKVVHVLGKTPPPEFKPPPIKKSDDCPPKPTRSTIKSAVSQQTAAERRSSQKSGESSNSNSVRFDASATQEKFTREGAGQRKSSGSGEGIPQIGGFYPAIHSLPQFQIPIMGTDIYRPQPLAWTPAFGPIIQVLPTGQDAVSMQGYLGQPSWMMPDPSTGAWYPALPQPFVGQNSLFQGLPQQQTAPLAQPGSLFSTFSLPDPHLAIPNAYSFPTYNPSTGQAPSQFSPYAASFTPSGTDPSIQRSLQDLIKEHQSLSGQLANLDRYMAMHVFEMDAETKQNLVEQRRNLVKELDAARKYKEHLESGIKMPSSISDASLPAAPVF